MAGVWTNNWRAFRNIMVMGAHHNGLSTITNISGVTVADQSGHNITALSPMGVYNNEFASNNALNCIRVGTGSTAPAATDYNLEAPASVQYLSIATLDPVYNDSLGTMSRTIVLSVQNQGSNNISIREWGIFGAIRQVVYNPTTIASALLYREVLDSPVVLAQYQTATIQVTVSLTLSDPVS